MSEARGTLARLGSASGRRLRLAACALLLALPLPAAVAIEHRAVDPLRYFSMARFVVEQGRLGREVMERFHDPGPVVRRGPTEFPPLFPLLAAGAVAVHPGLRSVQVVDALLMTAAVILLAALGRRVLGPGVATLCVALWIAWPGAFWMTVMGWNEPLALLVSVVALTVAAAAPRGPLPAAAAGALVALAHVARPELALLAVGLALFRAARDPAGWRRGARREALPLLATALALIVSFHLLQSRAFPDRVLSQAFLYQLKDDRRAPTSTESEAVRLRVGRSRPRSEVAAVVGKAGAYAVQVAAAAGLPIAMTLLLGWQRTRAGKPLRAPRDALLLFGVPAALLLLLHTATWSVPVSFRYFSVPFFLGLPLAAGAAAAAWTGTRGVSRIVLAAALVCFVVVGAVRQGHRTVKSLRLAGAQDAAFFLVDEPTEWTDPAFVAASHRLARRAAGGPLGAVNGWLLNYVTGAPAVVLPVSRMPAGGLEVARALPLRGWIDSPYRSEHGSWPGTGRTVATVDGYALHVCGADHCRRSHRRP